MEIIANTWQFTLLLASDYNHWKLEIRSFYPDLQYEKLMNRVPGLKNDLLLRSWKMGVPLMF